MSAAEIIEMIKKLPPEEKAEVMAFVQKENSGADAIRRLDRDRAKAIGKEVFDHHPELFRKLAQ